MIKQPGTKAHCDGEINWGKIFFNLLARTLEIIFYMTLQRLIGRKSAIFSGDLTFGIRTIWV